MPRYFFDIEEDGVMVMDQQGCEYASQEAAKTDAIVTAASIGRDIFAKALGTRVLVRVRGNEITFEAEVRLRTQFLAKRV